MKHWLFLLAFLLCFHPSQEQSISPLRIALKRRSLSVQDFQSLISLLNEQKEVASSRSQSFLSVRSESQSKIQLKNYANTQFVGEIGLGSPPQWLDVIFDTGSGNFFLNSKLCDSPSCLSRPAFDDSLSSSYIRFGDHIEVEFGTGSVEGEINSDLMHLGGTLIGRQDFAETTEENGDVFYGGQFSGILGLGFDNLAAPGTVPVFTNLVENEVLESNIVTFYYSLDPSETSEVLFGAIDESKFEGDIIWIPIDTSLLNYWLIEIDDIRLGDTSLELCNPTCKAALDTGTTLLAAPFEGLSRMYGILDDDCTQFEEYPDLVFVVGENEFRVKANDYVITSSVFGGEDDPGIHSEHSVDCSLGIMALDVAPPDGPLWVLGDIFLAAYYSIFDRDNYMVGLATATHK